MEKRISRSAFTLIELALAMAFISVLLLSIGIVTTQIGQIYQKGLTIKSVNAAGRELVKEFTDSIAATHYPNNWDQTGANVFKMAGIIKYKVNDDEVDAVPYGAFCTGQYSYIWNSGYSLGVAEGVYQTVDPTAQDFLLTYNTNKKTFSFAQMPTNPTNAFRLMRFEDRDNKICENFDTITANQLTGISNETELISQSEDNLALFGLRVFEPIYHSNTQHAFFSGTFILGTIRGGPNITADKDICSDASNANLTTDFVYCSINRFSFSARAVAEKRP